MLNINNGADTYKHNATYSVLFHDSIFYVCTFLLNVFNNQQY